MKILPLLTCSLLLALLAGCGAAPQADAPAPEEAARPSGQGEALAVRIVDGAGTGSLLLAGEGSGDVYTLAVAEETPIFLDGSPADLSALEDGMPIRVFFTDGVEETWPARPQGVTEVLAFSHGTAENPGGGYYDLCGLYLQVLEDLWEKDAGLNDGITAISVDLSQAPGGLTDGEKAAVAHLFTSRHGDALSAYSYTYEELVEQGLITGTDPAAGEIPQWKDGLLFRIAPEEGSGTYSLPTLRFTATKWRSAMGAYGFDDCSAVWPEMGTWTGYTIGAEFIS